MRRNGTRPDRSAKRGDEPAAADDKATESKAGAQDAETPEAPPLVVGIGASAGGLEAFRAFFEKMPADSGMSFVLVQHLDPNYSSALVPIVGGYTAMPVLHADEGTEVAPDHVYIIPPDSILTIENRILHIAQPATSAARRVSINTFLAALAADQGENAVGIILSGFGSDGALGIAAIKEHGGLTLSQAEFDHHAMSGMPQSAASGGFVDHVLSVEDMPAALLNYQHHRTIGDAAKGPDGLRQDLPSHLTTICAVLHSRLGRDFSQYKPGTLTRRIQRRMHVLQVDEVPAYIEQLRTLPHEAELLFRELLISVTRFFRDPEVLAALETKVIPALLADSHSADPIRIWVPGCATGEEAYSIAILVKEGLRRSDSRRPVQIFATDIDDRAIEAARAGLYLEAIAADLSPERLAANFVKENGHYRVSKDLREMCLFSMHDIVKDPPFSRLDLISCRNLLIYLGVPLQRRVLTTFHYALTPGRYLLLGTSEGVAAQSNLFASIDKRHRLFQRQDATAQLPAFALSHPADRHPTPRIASPTKDDIDQRAARAMAQYAPAFLVVDGQHTILRFSGQTAPYLEPATGIASLNLFTLLHPDLRIAARAALRRAAATGEPEHSTINIKTGERNETLNLIIRPLSAPGEAALFVVAFQSVERVGAGLEDTAQSGLPREDHRAFQNLERELLSTKERLRSVTEELEAANEELQSSNEEYLSVNEELQSANEELVTSKEELQALNEELQTINAELNHRNDGLMRSNSDLANLFDSTSIATLFLDNDLRIRRFTPRLFEIFNMREGDEGRPISDIVSRLTRDGLRDDVQHVLRTLVPIEREVSVAEGMSYLMQVRPYRNTNNTIDGAVVTFVDISERKTHEQARAQLAAIVASSKDAIVSLGLDGTIKSWNGGAEQLFGYSVREAVGQPMATLLGEDLPEEWQQLLTSLEGGERIADLDSVRTAKDGRQVQIAITISPLEEDDGRIIGASLIARDIRERKAAEQKTALLLGELDHRVKNILAVVSAVVSQTLKASPTPEAFTTEVEGRVEAIAKAHSLLTRTGQGEMSLHAMVSTELAPYERDGKRLTIGGRDVALTPKAGLALAMAVHELVSNAVKYGALAMISGRLAVTSTITGGPDERRLKFVWVESGGPPVQRPTRRGFGTTLIERTLTHELDAEVHREFLAEGVRCTIEMPLTDEIGREQSGSIAGNTR